VLRALGLGDLLAGVPALRALRAARPDHEVVLAAPEELTPLVRLTGAVDRLLPARGLAPLAWREAPPDLAVDLHGCGPESHRLLQATRPGALVAFDCSAVGHRGPRWDPDEHERDRWCRLVADSLGVEADPDDLLLSAPDVSPDLGSEGLVLVHPGAAHPSRRWPPVRFAAVARALARAGFDVHVTGGPAEVALAEEVRRRAGLPPAALLAGRTDLGELAALVAGARLMVSGDTGTAHLASAFGTPSVVLFGPTPPGRWGPPHDPRHVAIWKGREIGDPWGDEVDPALLEIGVEEVLDHALALLLSPPAAPPAGPRAGRREPAPRTTRGSG